MKIFTGKVGAQTFFSLIPAYKSKIAAPGSKGFNITFKAGEVLLLNRFHAQMGGE